MNSLTFIMLFLPVFLGTMYIIKNNNHRNMIVLLFSLIFYFYNDSEHFLLLLGMIVLTYYFGKLVNQHNGKVYYFIYLVLVVSLLSIFKYGNYFVDTLDNLLLHFNIRKLIMPLGISFYTFTSISYVSDCLYKKIEPDNNLINIACYISFFPTVVSGPILRYTNFKTFLNNKDINYDSLAKGLRRFVIGLFKKTIISNQLAIIVTTLFSSEIKLSFVLAWVGAVVFMLQLFYDFSSYSDMAISVSGMIGLSIPENFNNPYMALSIQDFWRRWHISLSSWFRDYVYIPLGGSRVSTTRWFFNTFCVWTLTGIWHGSTFGYLVWGIYNAILLVLNKFAISKIKLPKIVSWVMTQLMVLFGFLIFRIGSLHQLKQFIKNMLGMGEIIDLFYIKSLDIHYLWIYILLAIIFIFPIAKKAFYSIEKKSGVVFDFMIVILLFISLVFIISGSYSSFIYAGF